MPGGGGVQGVQSLYNLGAKDGTAIGSTPAGPVKEPLMGGGKVDYDLRKFNWVGSLTNEDTVCLDVAHLADQVAEGCADRARSRSRRRVRPPTRRSGRCCSTT